MDLVRAIAFLRAADDAAASSNTREAVDACRIAAKHVIDPSIRNNEEFEKLVVVVMGGLLKMAGAVAFDLWSAAEESLHLTIKTLLPTFGDRIMIELFKGIKTGKSARTKRVALRLFGRLAASIPPSRTRKFTTSLLPQLLILSSSDDEQLQEALGQASDGIFAVVALYMQEQEARDLVQQLLDRLSSHSSPMIRRAISSVIVAVCAHYPKNQLAFVLRSVLLRHSALFPALAGHNNSNASDTEQAASADETSSPVSDHHLVLGSLTCLIQIVAYYTSTIDFEWQNRFECQASVHHCARRTQLQQDFLARMPDLLMLINHSLKNSDHNVISMALELLQQLLSIFGADYVTLLQTWPHERSSGPRSLIDHLIEAVCSILVGDRAATSRTSVRAAAAACCAVFAAHFYQHLLAFVHKDHERPSPTGDPHSAALERILALRFDEDPLLQANARLIIGHLISSFLQTQNRESWASSLQQQQQQHEQETDPDIRLQLDVPTLVHSLIQGVCEASSVSGKISCVALAACIDQLAKSSYSDLVLQILESITTLVQAYWLVKCELAHLLKQLDFVVIREIERSQKPFLASSLHHPPKDIQRRVFEFIVLMLEDEDKRVVQAGANALPVLLMNLCASERYRDGGGLTRSELAYYNVLHWFHSPQEVNGRLEERANGNLLWALPSLLRGTNCQSSRLRTLAVLGGSAPAAGAPSGSGGSGGADDSSLSYGGGYYRAFAELARHNRHQFRAHKRRELLQRPMSRGDVRLNLDAFSKELVFLGLERCINGSISDLDTHCDVLLCCADLFRAVEVPEEGASSSTTAPTPSASKDPIVIAKLWKPVSAHILKILNILATIIRDPETPVKLRSNKPNGSPGGFYQHLLPYVRLHERLCGSWTNSLSSFDASKFERIWLTSLKVLCGTARIAGKAMAPLTEELFEYFSTFLDHVPHLPSHNKWIVLCIRELFMACVLDSRQSTSNNAGSSGSGVKTPTSSSSSATRSQPGTPLSSSAAQRGVAAASSPSVLEKQSTEQSSNTPSRLRTLGAMLWRAAQRSPQTPPSQSPSGIATVSSPAVTPVSTPVTPSPTPTPAHPDGVDELQRAAILSELKAPRDGLSELLLGKPSTLGLGDGDSDGRPQVIDSHFSIRSSSAAAPGSPLVLWQNDASKAPLRKLIMQVLKRLMQLYQQTHSASVQRVTLLLLSDTLECGIDYRAQLDPNNAFVEHVTQQVLGRKSYLPSPPTTLPIVFRFVCLVASYYPTSVPANSVQALTACAFSSPYWGSHGGLLATIMPTLLLLFRRIEQPHLRPLREYYVQQLLSKVHLVHAIPPLMLVHSLQSDATELKQRVCNALTEGLFPLLAHTNATPLVRSWEEIAAYEALFAAVNFHDHCTLEQLLRTILTVGTAFSVFDASQLEGVAPSRHALSDQIPQERYHASPFIAQMVFSVLQSIGTLLSALCLTPDKEELPSASEPTSAHDSRLLADSLTRLLRSGHALIGIGVCQFWFRARLPHPLWLRVAGLVEYEAWQALTPKWVPRVVGSAAFLAYCSFLLQPIPYDAVTVERALLRAIEQPSCDVATPSCTSELAASSFAARIVLHARESIVRSLLTVVCTSQACFLALLESLRRLILQRGNHSDVQWLRKAALIVGMLPTMPSSSSIEPSSAAHVIPAIEYLRVSATLLHSCVSIRSHSLFVSSSQLLKNGIDAVKGFNVPVDLELLLGECVAAMDKHLRLHTPAYKSFRSLLVAHSSRSHSSLPRLAEAEGTLNATAKEVEESPRSSSRIERLQSISTDALRELVISRFNVVHESAHDTAESLPLESIATNSAANGAIDSGSRAHFRSLHLVIQLNASVFLELLQSNRLDLPRLASCISDASSYGLKSEILTFLQARLRALLEVATPHKRSLSKLACEPVDLGEQHLLTEADQLAVCFLNFCTQHHSLALRQPECLEQLLRFCVLGLESNFAWQRSCVRPQALCSFLELSALLSMYASHCSYTSRQAEIDANFAALQHTAYQLFQSVVLAPLHTADETRLYSLEIRSSPVETEAPDHVPEQPNGDESRSVPSNSTAVVQESETPTGDDVESAEEQFRARVEAIKHMIRATALADGSVSQRRLVARYGTRCYRAFARLVLVFAHVFSSELIVPSIEVDMGEVFIELGLATTADREAAMLRAMIRMLPLTGFLHAQQFNSLWEAFTEIVEEKGNVELLRCLAINGMVAQLLTLHRLCNTTASVRTVTASPARRKSGVSLESLAGPMRSASSHSNELVFLESPHGRKLQLLLQAIETAVTSTQRQAQESSPTVYVEDSAQAEFRFNAMEERVLGFSAFQVGNEIRSLQHMIQSIKEVEQIQREQREQQEAAAAAAAQRNDTASTARAEPAAATPPRLSLPVSAASDSTIDFEFYQLHALALLESTLKASNESWMLRQTLLKALVALSDTFTLPQIWLQMMRSCLAVLQSSDSDDFLSNQYALAGLAKSLSALYLMGVYQPNAVGAAATANYAAAAIVATVSEPTASVVCGHVQAALDSSRASLCLAGFKAFVQFATCAVQEIAVPLLPAVLGAISKMAEKSSADLVASASSAAVAAVTAVGGVAAAAAAASATTAATIATPLSNAAASPLPTSGSSSTVKSDRGGTPSQASHSNIESKVTAPTVVTMRLHEHMLAALFLALQQYPRHTEVQSFAKVALDYALRLGASASTPPRIMRVIFRGFTRVLTSFSLSHTHRDYINSFALSKLASEHFLLAMGLMITCMYTGDQSSPDQFSLSHDSTLIHMDNMERIKTMIAKIQEGFAYEGEAVAKVVPQILQDFFTVDQIMSLVLGEFVRTPLSGRPELMAHVLFKVLRQLTVTSEVAKWIIMCLNNFLQMIPFRYCVWSLTCLFIAASSNGVLQGVFLDYASSVCIDEELFIIAAVEFYRRPQLDENDRKMFIQTFSHASQQAGAANRLFDQLVAVCHTSTIVSTAPDATVV